MTRQVDGLWSIMCNERRTWRWRSIPNLDTVHKLIGIPRKQLHTCACCPHCLANIAITALRNQQGWKKLKHTSPGNAKRPQSPQTNMINHQNHINHINHLCSGCILHLFLVMVVWWLVLCLFVCLFACLLAFFSGCICPTRLSQLSLWHKSRLLHEAKPSWDAMRCQDVKCWGESSPSCGKKHGKLIYARNTMAVLPKTEVMICTWHLAY